MTLREKVYRFLQVDNKCAYCGRALDLRFFHKGPDYYKMKMFPQSPWGSWRWLKQVYTGDDYVLRFCDLDHYLSFATEGKLIELVAR